MVNFDDVLAAEDEVRMMQTIIAFQAAGLSTYEKDRQRRSLEAAKARLAAFIDPMNIDELRAFGEHRTAVRSTK